MEIFSRLIFGHFLADFTLQTNFIAEGKRRKFWILLVHVFTHPVCYLPLLWPYLNDTWKVIGGVTINGWGAIGIVTVLHFIEDYFRVTMVNRGWRDNTLFYLWDQGVHILCLWWMAPTSSQALATTWPILGTLAVLVTHFATVTVWFIEKDFRGTNYPEAQEKYISILQRLVVWMAFFLPHPYWIVAVIAVLGAFFSHMLKRRLDFSLSSLLMGNTIALVCGFVARFGLHTHF